MEHGGPVQGLQRLYSFLKAASLTGFRVIDMVVVSSPSCMFDIVGYNENIS